VVKNAASPASFRSKVFIAWLPGFGAGFLVSLPFSFLLPPLLQKVMAKLHIEGALPLIYRYLAIKQAVFQQKGACACSKSPVFP
jgi:hypothetical protein